MCGIVAAVAQRDVISILLKGLHNLEYRGYDSAGMAAVMDGQLKRLRTKGKVADLEELQERNPLSSQVGIAHTRWATHGKPSTENAHPHTAGDRLALVHNGIIENHQEIRRELMDRGHEFSSQTDTEVIVGLVLENLGNGQGLAEAVRCAVSRLKGAYAIAVLDKQQPDQVVGARRGSPLVVGLGFGEHFLASDIFALLPVTNRFVRLEDGDIVTVRRDGYDIVDVAGDPVSRSEEESSQSADQVSKGDYRHFMLKEIYEQPDALADTLAERLGSAGPLPGIFGEGSRDLLGQAQAVHIVACGTSYHAGLVARYWIESLTGLPCMVEVASEYRYRRVAVRDNTLFVAISQSGETADTLAALTAAAERGYLARLAICNVPESAIVREADLVLMTRAGLEIGVASTKAFTTQLAALALLALELAGESENTANLTDQLRSLPQHLQRALELDAPIAHLAEHFSARHHALFVGRGVQFPVAREGALKLKEISYIHAEAYPAGELKHGPLALVDEDMPVIAVAPNDNLLEKLMSNIAEVRARGGEMFVFADAKAAAAFDFEDDHLITLSQVPEFIAPIVFTIPLQLLAYHVAVLKGTDVDQPRNLAKSVTVE